MKSKLLTLLALLFIVTVSARSENKKVEMTKVNETTWEFQMPNKTVELTMNFDDGTTAIINIKNGQVKKVVWTDLNGRRLPSEPDKTGFYIKDGKLVMIKK